MTKRRRTKRNDSLPKAERQPARPERPPARNTSTNVIPTTSQWEVSPVADRHSLRLTTECLADIAVSVTRVNARLGPGPFPTRIFQRECRDISTRIRKLILPNGEELLKQCFIPTMHPLKLNDADSNPETLTEWMGDISLEYTLAGEDQPREVTLPTQHQHETVVGPFYGLTRTSHQTYHFDDPFDWAAAPLRLGQWLNFKVLRVDDLTINAERLLRMMVNSEGAHSELDEMATANPAFTVPVAMGPPDSEPYRRTNVINLSGISLVQIFTFLVGFYLVRMMRATLRHIPHELTQFGFSNEIWRDILATPTQLATAKLLVDRPYDMGAVLQNTGNTELPFTLIGDYRNPPRTIVRAP